MEPSVPFEIVEFDEFMRRCLLLIKNPKSPDVVKRMIEIEAHRQIGGNSKPVKCNGVGNCTLLGLMLLKYANNPVPEIVCQNHLFLVKKDLHEKPWELFGHPPIVVEFAALVTNEVSPRMIRARLAQFRELT